jgi:1-acyl-sn-glycerol-3-phosphate acyltransferase
MAGTNHVKTEALKKRRRGILHLLYQPYKYLIFAPLLALSTCFFVGLGVIIIFLFDDYAANRTVGVWWSRFNSYITPMRVTVNGKENIVKNQSYIVVSNHQSSYDIFVLFGWLGIDLKWVIKTELRKYPVFGYAVEKGGNIIIDRSKKKEAYQELKKGAFWMAQELDLPILPVSISGTRHILPPKTLDLFPGRAVMKVHEPVDIHQYDEDSQDRLISDVREIIRKGLEGQQ